MTFKSAFQAQFLQRSGPIKVGLKDPGLNDRAWTSYTQWDAKSKKKAKSFSIYLKSLC
jgi:hypothetical protein